MASRLPCIKPDFCVLIPSIVAFLIAFIPSPLFESLFGQYALFSQAWIMIGVGFHEIGHLVFGFLISPLVSAIPPFAFLAEPLRYLGGFLFNAIVAVILLPVSLSLQSRIPLGKLSKRSQPMVFSFMFIAYLNLFMVPYTLTHLQHVVGPGFDFTMASFLLSITLEALLIWLWAVAGATFVLAVLANIFFVFRK